MTEFLAIFEAIGAWFSILSWWQQLIIVAVLLFWFFVTTWEHYVAGMHFKNVLRRGQLYPTARIFASLLVLRALIMDAVFNQIFGLLLLLELPFYHLVKKREVLFMHRLRRLKHRKPGGYRWWMANWFCTRMLDQFERPGEKHC